MLGPHMSDSPPADCAVSGSSLAQDARWAVLDAVSDGTAIVDGDRSILFASQPLGDLFGYRPADLVGQEIEVLLEVRGRSQHRRIHDKFHQAPWVRPLHSGLTLHGRHKSGALIPVDIRLHPLAAALVAVTVRDLRSDENQLAASEAATTREHEARASLDLVRQRLFGVGMSLDALAAVGSPEVVDCVEHAARVIDDTMALINSIGLGSPTDPRNFAPMQAHLQHRQRETSCG